MLIVNTALPIRVRNVVQEARVQRGGWGVSAQQSWSSWKVVGEEVLDIVLELLAVRHTTAGCHLKDKDIRFYFITAVESIQVHFSTKHTI